MAANNLIVGLDIGTTKVAVVVAEVDQNDEVRIVGVGTSLSEGIKRGVVVNLEKTVQSIQKAVEDAELMAGVEITSAYAGIAGEHIKSINSKGFIAVSRQDNEITREDVERVIGAAKTVAIPMDREIIHILPQQFIVDGQGGIKDPVGMSGLRLEAEVHIVTGATTSVQNLTKCIQRAGLDVQELVLQPLASAYAVLTPDEEEMGVALLDIGGGTTDIAILYENSIRHTAMVGLGGRNVTSDIAIGLRTSLDQAEEIKKKYGCTMTELVKENETFAVPGLSGRPSREVSRRELAAMIEPRMEELFLLAQQELRKSEFADLLVSGVVLTGGGASMVGAVDLAERVFNLQAKVGNPRGFGGLMDSVKNPGNATGVGLIYYGLKHRARNAGGAKKNRPGGGVFERTKRWFESIF
jgi:cell division protein FtsA